MKADPSQFIKVIELKDRSGRVIGTKEVVTYQGLLSKAHEEGLKSIRTSLLQIPGEENARTAIAKAVVDTEKGSFEGLGDASPENVTSFLEPHLIRMAETRAKARALRDAVNVGVISFEELDGEDLPGRESDLGSGVKPNGAANGPTTAPPRRRGKGLAAPIPEFVGMTENQRRFLFRILSEDGLRQEAAHEHLLDRFQVGSLQEVSKEQASQMIDELQTRPPRATSNGGAALQR